MKKQFQNEPDIVGLINTIREQLVSLDKKVDLLINKSLSPSAEVRPAPKPSFQPSINTHIQAGGRSHDQHKARQMYRAVCADCKKECEIPFRPSGDRPVYCKECFLRRKTSHTLKAAAENKPQEIPPVPTVVNAVIDIQEPTAKEKRSPVAVRKSVGKKKLVAKKKKK